MEKIMRKSNDTSKLGDVTLDGHRALADGELASVSGGAERQKKHITKFKFEPITFEYGISHHQNLI
jgi:hypothetical protein